MKKSLLILALLICSLTNYAQQTGTFKDPRDGKEYRTVKIGNQTWFAENLAYKPGRGNYWAYKNDKKNIYKYGYLYDGETALKICPSGWRLPNEKDIHYLVDSFGSVGRNLYEALIPNGRSGLSLLFAGACIFPEFFDMGKQARVWTNMPYQRGLMVIHLDKDKLEATKNLVLQ